MGVNNIVGGKIEASKSELETTIEMKPDGNKYVHMKNLNFHDIKISHITSNKPSLYSEQTTADIMKCPLLKSHDKY